MNNLTLAIIIGVGLLAIVFGLAWRARIRKSKMEDPDFDRNQAAKEKAEMRDSA